jgi:uncharacterized protein
MRIRLLIVAVIVMGSCSYGSANDSGKRRAGPAFERATALIDTGTDSVLLEVEVADDNEERARGLMFRKSLPEKSGMVFIFFQESSGGFWMKNTLIPLSIAYFDENGKILRILDMEPCKADPCPTYEPGVSYWGAIEVNRGAFARWNVEVGDTITVS